MSGQARLTMPSAVAAAAWPSFRCSARLSNTTCGRQNNTHTHAWVMRVCQCCACRAAGQCCAVPAVLRVPGSCPTLRWVQPPKRGLTWALRRKSRPPCAKKCTTRSALREVLRDVVHCTPPAACCSQDGRQTPTSTSAGLHGTQRPHGAPFPAAEPPPSARPDPPTPAAEPVHSSACPHQRLQRRPHQPASGCAP